jgi:ribose transport system permease protein
MTDEVISEAPPERRRPALGGASAQLGLLVIIIAFWIIFSSRAPGFLSSFNLFTLGRALAVDIVIGFAQMVVLATGGMNLAVGSIGVCAVMTSGYLMQTLGLPWPAGIAGALVLGTALGWANGFAIVKSGVNAFIITLASANLFSGGMLILTKAVPLNGLPPEVGAFGKMRINLFTPVLPVSPLLIVAVLIGIALFVIYRYSLFGRQVLAAGANPRAAAMSGVPVGRAVIISHALSGLLAAVAGVMVVARLGAAMPAVGGEDWLLPSFLGPALGGTLLSGGLVSVVGTMLGAFLVTTIRSGLLVLQIGNFWLQLFLGLILLLAVLLDRYRSVLTARRRLARQ